MLAGFHAARVNFQVMLTLLLAPTVVALLGVSLVPLVVERALSAVEPATSSLAVTAVRVAMVTVVGAGFVAAWGGALLLRASLRRTVDEIREATEAIAAGDFRHRIASVRRDELGALANAIDGAAIRLERLEQARRQLLACVSHELRTPVTIARGFAFSLARSEQDRTRSVRFEQIDGELARVGALIDDLIDAASLHAGGVRLHRERAGLREQVGEAVARFRQASEERGVAIALRVSGAGRRSADALVDIDRLQQIVANLLANAVRHAVPGTTVDVHLACARREGELHRLDVTNVGAAVPAADRERIFEPFVQCGAHVGRVGLGLAIARDLAEAHGGALELVSPDDGTCVTFRLSLPSVRRVGAERVVEQVRRARGTSRRTDRHSGVAS